MIITIIGICLLGYVYTWEAGQILKLIHYKRKMLLIVSWNTTDSVKTMTDIWNILLSCVTIVMPVIMPSVLKTVGFSASKPPITSMIHLPLLCNFCDNNYYSIFDFYHNSNNNFYFEFVNDNLNYNRLGQIVVFCLSWKFFC